MNYLILILLILFRLDSLWANSNLRNLDYTLDKAAIVSYYEEINGYVTVVDIAEEPLPATVEFQLFAGPDGDGRWLGGTGADRGTQDFYSHYYDTTIKGRSARGCFGYVIVNGRLKYSNNPFYGTPLYMATIAHEAVHVVQRLKCLSPGGEDETIAEVASWAMLASHAKQWKYTYRAAHSEAALIYDLRHRFIEAALDLHYKQGKEPKFLERLHLTDAELAYYKSLTPEWLALRSEYWTDSIGLLLFEADDDGTVETKYTQTGVVNLRNLYDYLYAEGILYEH